MRSSRIVAGRRGRRSRRRRRAPPPCTRCLRPSARQATPTPDDLPAAAWHKSNTGGRPGSRAAQQGAHNPGQPGQFYSAPASCSHDSTVVTTTAPRVVCNVARRTRHTRGCRCWHRGRRVVLARLDTRAGGGGVEAGEENPGCGGGQRARCSHQRQRVEGEVDQVRHVGFLPTGRAGGRPGSDDVCHRNARRGRRSRATDRLGHLSPQLIYPYQDGKPITTVEVVMSGGHFPDTRTPGHPDTRHPTPDTRHPTPDTRHPTPDTRHPTPDTGHR